MVLVRRINIQIFGVKGLIYCYLFDVFLLSELLYILTFPSLNLNVILHVVSINAKFVTYSSFKDDIVTNKHKLHCNLECKGVARGVLGCP